MQCDAAERGVSWGVSPGQPPNRTLRDRAPATKPQHRCATTSGVSSCTRLGWRFNGSRILMAPPCNRRSWTANGTHLKWVAQRRQRPLVVQRVDGRLSRNHAVVLHETAALHTQPDPQARQVRATETRTVAKACRGRASEGGDAPDACSTADRAKSRSLRFHHSLGTLHRARHDRRTASACAALQGCGGCDAFEGSERTLTDPILLERLRDLADEELEHVPTLLLPHRAHARARVSRCVSQQGPRPCQWGLRCSSRRGTLVQWRHQAPAPRCALRQSSRQFWRRRSPPRAPACPPMGHRTREQADTPDKVQSDLAKHKMGEAPHQEPRALCACSCLIDWL